MRHEQRFLPGQKDVQYGFSQEVIGAFQENFMKGHDELQRDLLLLASMRLACRKHDKTLFPASEDKKLLHDN